MSSNIWWSETSKNKFCTAVNIPDRKKLVARRSICLILLQNLLTSVAHVLHVKSTHYIHLLGINPLMVSERCAHSNPKLDQLIYERCPTSLGGKSALVGGGGGRREMVGSWEGIVMLIN